MINNSSRAQSLRNIPTIVVLTRILRVFPNGKFDPSLRVTDKSSAGKTLSRLQNDQKILPSPFLGGIPISLGFFFGSAACSGSGAVFYSPSFSD